MTLQIGKSELVYILIVVIKQASVFLKHLQLFGFDLTKIRKLIYLSKNKQNCERISRKSGDVQLLTY